MRGIGFFETLAALPEGDARFEELTAGLFVFRVAETALRRGEVDSQAVWFANKHLRGLSRLTAAGRLRDILEAARVAAEAGEEWQSVLGAKLLAYGLDLHAMGFAGAAIDVFSLISDVVHGDDDLRLQAVHRRAYAYRELKQFDDAVNCYSALELLARSCGNEHMALEAQLGYAKVALDRGNTPAAEPIVNAVIERAIAAGDTTILAKARIDAARIAGLRNDPVGVLENSFLALEGLEKRTPTYDRALRNISMALRAIGRATAARRVALYLATHGQERDQRLASTLLLYHLAIDVGDFELASEYREELARATLTPSLAAEYYEAVARECAARGDFESAQGAVARMLAVAEEFKLAELIIRADSALADVRREIVPAVYAYHPVPLGRRLAGQMLAPIEHALYHLCPA